MKRIIIYIILFILSQDAFSQDLNFVKTFYGNSNDNPGDLKISKSGNIYISGTFENDSIKIEDYVLYAPVQNRVNYFIAKLDTSGHCLWANFIFSDTIYDNFSNIAIDSNENIYFTSSFSMGFDINPTAITQYLSPINGFRSIMLSKYDSNGVFDYGFQIKDSATFPKSIYLEIDNNQDIILSSTLFGQSDFDPDPTNTYFLQANSEVIREAFIAKYSSFGNFIWAYKFDEQTFGILEINDLTTDTHNNIIITGYIFASVDMNINSPSINLYNSNGSWDYFLAKYSPSADLLWAFNVGSWTNERGVQVSTNEYDSIFVGGEMRSNVVTDFDHSPTETVNLITTGESDVFYAKYDANGTLDFIKKIGGINIDYLSDMYFDKQDNVYWAIHFWSNNWDSDFSDSINNITAIGAGDDLIMCTDKNGKVKYSFTIGSNFTDNFTRKIVNFGSSFFLLGWYNGNLGDYDPNSGIVYPNFYSGTEITLAKYSVFNKEWSISDNDDTDLEIYPNPISNGLLNIESASKIENAFILDLQGKKCSYYRIQNDKVVIDLSNFEKGIYLLNIESQGKVFVKKILIQ